jgi:hypothetical protein
MTFSDPSLERPLEQASNLTREGARPLTDDEKKAADRDAPAGERVYAPASQRVPVDPVPGHRDFVEHPDTHTPERQATGQTATMQNDEPSFTRVARPSVTPTPGAYASPLSNPGLNWDESNDYPTMRPDRRRTMFVGIGASWFSVIACGVGAWLFMRWRREHNKPINRLRRQARQAMQTASELRDRVPSPEEAARPAIGVTTALLSMLVLLWQQSQTRSRRAQKTARKAAESVSDVDWYKRLNQLKERWSPVRVELEKRSISRR